MKVYRVQERIGRARYVISFHDGVKTHRDGSKFFDTIICKSKKEASQVVANLKREGYTAQ